MKTSEQWYKDLENWATIIDYDWWDRQNFQYSYYEELITEREFFHRLFRSTTDRMKK
jgi:hypothetical protein